MPSFINRCALILFLGFTTVAMAASEPLSYEEQAFMIQGTRQTLRLPKGFRLELLTDKLAAPRLLSFAANGDLFIGSHSGKIYRLAPPYTAPEVLVTLDDYPHSVALRPGEMLIARTDG